MTYLREDLKFLGYLPDHDYKKLRLHEKLVIIDCDHDVAKLKGRMTRWGRPLGRKFVVRQDGNKTFISCVPRPLPAVKLPPAQRKTRSRMIVKVARRRKGEANRTAWVHDKETGVYHCQDRDDKMVWEIRRVTDPVWPWIICRNGEDVAKSRTIYDAKIEAALLK